MGIKFIVQHPPEAYKTFNKFLKAGKVVVGVPST